MKKKLSVGVCSLVLMMCGNSFGFESSTLLPIRTKEIAVKEGTTTNFNFFTAPTAGEPAPAGETTPKDNSTGFQLRRPKVLPGIKYVAGSTQSNLVPEVDLSDTFSFVDTRTPTKQEKFGLIYNLSFKPQPASSSVSDVSQAIRADAGIVTLNAGISAAAIKLFSDPIVSGVKNPLGLQIDATVQGSYQDAAATGANGPTDTSLTRTNFYTIAPDVKIGVYLVGLYLGYKYDYYKTSGGNSSITGQVNKTSTHNVFFSLPFGQDSGGLPIYLECKYTGGPNTFGHGTFTTAFAAKFDNNN